MVYIKQEHTRKLLNHQTLVLPKSPRSLWTWLHMDSKCKEHMWNHMAQVPETQILTTVF